MNIYNDRLGIKNNRKDYKSNIPLVLESADSTKMEKKEVNGVCINNDNVCLCRG